MTVCGMQDASAAERWMLGDLAGLGLGRVSRDLSTRDRGEGGAVEPCCDGFDG